MARLVASERLVGAEGPAADGALELGGRESHRGRGRRLWRLDPVLATAAGEHEEAEREVLLLGSLPRARALPLGPPLQHPAVCAALLRSPPLTYTATNTTAR